jgi:hypothetical protein
MRIKFLDWWGENEYGILIWKPEGNRPLGTSKHKKVKVKLSPRAVDE